MKRKYIILLIILALPLLDVFYACCNCDIITDKKFYINTGFSLKNIDNSGQEPIESTSGDINKKAYGIRLQVNRQSLAFLKKQINQPLFSSSAYAMSCECDPEVTYDPKDVIEDVKIITLKNFNADKLVESDVTEYFRYSKDYLEISEIIQKLNYKFAYQLKDTEYFDLLLMVPPSETNIQHQFKVVITFENKQTVELIATVNLI